MTPTIPEPRINGVPLQEYVEMRMEEHRRQLDTASQEREKSAAVLREAQNRAMEQAEREREKAAIVMRESMDRAIKEGDERLREHIANQVQQINGALDSAEKLEQNRLDRAHADTDSVRREMQLITNASKTAVEKAEDAQKEVNEKSNEFRGQLADQAATLMPRREAEARNNELDRRVEEARSERLRQIEDARHEREQQLVTVGERLSQLERGDYGRTRVESVAERHQDRVQPWQIWAMGALITAVVIVSNLIASQ